MPTINLFDRCTGLLVLKDIYQIPDPVLRQILSRCIVRNGIYYEAAENGVSIFLEETGIHPDTYDVSDVKVHCKHITTAFDNGKSIKSLGFLPLTRLLEEESALSAFLRSNGIIVTPSRYRIEINGKKYRIPPTSEDCPSDVWEIFVFLSPTLYHDKGEVEAFVAGEEERMMSYSTVKRFPEILESLDHTVKEITGKSQGLGQKWMDLNPTTFMADFDVAIKDFSYNNRMKSRHDYPEAYWELEKYFEREKSEESNLIWQNEWIIRSCLNNACPGNEDDLNMVGIKSDVVIPGNSIALSAVNTDEEEL